MALAPYFPARIEENMSKAKKPLSLDELSQKIDSLKERRKPKGGQGSEAAAQSEASRVVSDVVLMPVAALVVGYALDQWFKTTPMLMMVFLIVGIVVGLYNLMRMEKK